MERQAASRRLVEGAAGTWAALAGGPSADHPASLSFSLETCNAQGRRVRVDVGVTSMLLEERS